MNTTRHTIAAALSIAVGVLLACSDSITVAPRRVDTPSPVGASREIPAQYAWVGDEHNRFVSMALEEYDFAGQSGDRTRRNALRRDCGALWDLMSREVHASARIGGFAGQEDALLALVRSSTLQSDGCARITERTLSLFPGSRAAPARFQAATIGQGQPWEMIAATLNQIAVARSPLSVRRIIGDAAAVASTLSPRDAQVAYSVLSLVRGSFEHWSIAHPARRASLALFLQDPVEPASPTGDNISWGGILATVGADASGCTSAARVVRTLDSGGGWTSVAAGCLIGGGVSSAGAAIAYK